MYAISNKNQADLEGTITRLILGDCVNTSIVYVTPS